MTLLNAGVAGAMLVYFAVKDYRESGKQDQRHKENIEQSKAVESAIRIHSSLILTGMAGIKNLDSSYSELLEKLQKANSQ